MPNGMATNKSVQTQSWQNRGRSSAAKPFVIAIGVCVLLTVCFVFSGPSEPVLCAEVELDSRLNPNDAPLASLVRLPGIGIVRAAAIVAYRRHFREEQSNRAAFETIDDLQKVKGIGPKTVENISEWLKFEPRISRFNTD